MTRKAEELRRGCPSCLLGGYTTDISSAIHSGWKHFDQLITRLRCARLREWPFHIFMIDMSNFLLQYDDTHFTFAGLSCLCRNLDMLCRKLNGSRIAICTHTANHRCRLILEITVVSERLPRMNIGDMTLNERNVNTQQRIANGDACVRECAGVDDNHVNIASCLMNAVDDRALPIRLESVEFRAQVGTLLVAGIDDIVEGCAAVEMGLAGAEEVEVRTVDEEDAARHCGLNYVLEDDDMKRRV